MTTIRSHALLAAAGLSALASLLHVVCILVGAPAYRLLGAGEGMARIAAAGYWFPTVVTSAIAAVPPVPMTPETATSSQLLKVALTHEPITCC